MTKRTPFPCVVRMTAVAAATIIAALLCCTGGSEAGGNSTPSRAELDGVLEWLWLNPPDGRNRAERRQKMAVIQAAADQLSPESFWQYEEACRTNSERADELEREGALYYLSRATKHALRDIRKTKVKKGLAVWHIYNMGYLFKTPEACFGIDLALRDAEQLAEELDFLLVTHEHGDHYSQELLDAMIRAKKPVITRWYPGSTIVTGPTEFRLGSVRVNIDIGDHHHEHPDGCDNMLMYQVDCGDTADRCTIYHSGDGNNYHKMKPDNEVNIFIVHVEVGMDIAEAMRHLKPRRTFVSHVLELGHSPHPPNAWRWSFDYAFSRVEDFPEDEAMVLTWGERWLLPGTVLAE